MRKKDLLLLAIYKLQKKGIASKRAIVKCMFLLKKECDIDNYMNFYSFYPYKQGPFSNVCYSDLRKLNQDGFIDENEVSVTEEGMGKLSTVSNKLDYVVNDLLERFDNEPQIMDYVYSKYPEYTVRSELIEHDVSQHNEVGYCTIGYEQKDIDNFLDVLIQSKIDVVVDVRRNPFSMNFSFSQKKLRSYLNESKIEYVHIPELGIESGDRKNLNSKADYDRLFKKYRAQLGSKQEYLNEIIELGQQKKIALLCFEKDVSFCHRGQIADKLCSAGHSVTNL